MICRIIAFLLVTASVNAGTLTFSVSNNNLRDRHLEYNPVSAQMERSTLIEGTSQTSLPWSFASTTQLNHSTLAQNATTATDGTITAIKNIQDTSAGFTHGLTFTTVNETVAFPVTYIMELKAGEVTKVTVITNPGNLTSKLNLLTGVAETIDPKHVISALPLGNGWFRWSMTTLSTAAVTYTSVQIHALNAAETDTFTGDGVGGYYIGLVNEIADRAFATSPIVNTGNSQGYLTPIYGSGRFPENFELDGTTIGTPAAITGFIEFIEKGTAQTAGAGICYLGSYDNATGARLYISTGTNGYRVTHHNGTSAVTSELAAFPSLGDLVRLRWTLSSTGVVQIFQSINGKTETSATASGTNTLAGTWGALDFYLNSLGGGTNQGFIAIRKVFVLSGSTHPLTDFLSL